jgi:hypothetical protein
MIRRTDAFVIGLLCVLGSVTIAEAQPIKIELVPAETTLLPVQEVPALGQNCYTIAIKNSSQSDIRVAVHYCELGGNWKTTSWSVVKAGMALPVARTTNPMFYTYAETTGKGKQRRWEGKDKKIKIGGDNYGFAVKRINLSMWGTWTENY